MIARTGIGAKNLFIIPVLSFVSTNVRIYIAMLPFISLCFEGDCNGYFFYFMQKFLFSFDIEENPYTDNLFGVDFPIIFIIFIG